MSTQEILQDIVSYAPALTGASKEQSGEKIASQICKCYFFSNVK